MSQPQVKKWISAPAMSMEYAAELGDARRTARARRVGVAISKKPESSFPQIFKDEADLEAYYRLTRNPQIHWRALMAPHSSRTVERAAVADEVLVVHDTTDVAFRTYWPDELRGQMSKITSRTQGFFGHASIAVTARGAALPLGMLDVQPYVHLSSVATTGETTREFWENEDGLFDNEHERWFRGVEGTTYKLSMAGVKAIHVMDRETDSYGLLAWMAESGFRFIVRCDASRSLRSEEPFRDVGLLSVMLGERFPLRDGKSNDTHPPRRSRQADLTIRTRVVTLKRAHKADGASWSPGGWAAQPRTLKLHLVEAVELNPPADEKGVRWLLLTTEPIHNAEEVLRVVDLYRRRWLVEEFFKALKTGCNLEKRQMESVASLLRVLALLIPAAWRLLLLRAVADEHPDASWKSLLTPLEFRILQRAVPKAKLQDEATVASCLAAIAKLGGHLPRNGPPGWQTLQAGWRQLQDYVTGSQLARGDPINA